MHITRRNFAGLLLAATAVAASLTSCSKSDQMADQSVLRIGFFPNITHAQALVGYHETNTKAAEGWFEKRTGRAE